MNKIMNGNNQQPVIRPHVQGFLERKRLESPRLVYVPNVPSADTMNYTERMGDIVTVPQYIPNPVPQYVIAGQPMQGYFVSSNNITGPIIDYNRRESEPRCMYAYVKEEGKNEDEVTSVYRCNVCNKIFQREAWLRRHHLSHTNDRNFLCPWCKSKHKRRDNLFKHIKLKHMELLMKAIREYYPLTDFEDKDLNELMRSGYLHREDIKRVFLHLIGLER
ncbi:hypothetical protein KAFR_0J00340 [Kazachstania africana CBS 2517]|uniref:C2H2-type domain-containing protein n=1 Tax=Kazachstania africana (strain ATCC 22294 / BCRC 22015 / CBS 2517 / CECT 1963 / NBRC 1671 / NRRL Y-8276) TaxID=1071382 RepID=H2B0F2_KAZAF|nr:hypothetical protein KAFR_0J00340 [Kazachstania africana CBS 2517]CCF60102.1 hypothetical protein KAFR_0J00340 [Kazachstania africana CBS 2517]